MEKGLKPVQLVKLKQTDGICTDKHAYLKAHAYKAHILQCESLCDFSIYSISDPLFNVFLLMDLKTNTDAHFFISHLIDFLCLSQGPPGPAGPLGPAVNNLFIFISLSNETDAHRTPLSDMSCLIFRV